MDQVTDLTTWKTLLTSFEETETDLDVENFVKLETLLIHLPSSVPPRLQKDYESCTLKSIRLFSELFDKIDLSDKPLLCSYLRMIRSFGYFRIAQMTFHTSSINEELEVNPIYLPTIVKTKWYDMEPVLPSAGTIGWKSIMNHGLVKEEQQLSTVCLQLLSLKLQFHAIISRLDCFQNCREVIDKSGRRVVEKLFELVRDVAYDDECMIGIDTQLFNLMSIFSDEEQRAAIVDAVVQDLFKPYLLQKEMREQAKIYELTGDCIMNKLHLQNIMFNKLLENLKCNMIRRKRRHSVEANLEDSIPLESVISDINNGKKFNELLSSLGDIQLSKKSLQTGYIDYWVQVVRQIITKQTTLAVNSIKIISTCAVLLISASELLGPSIAGNLSALMAEAIQGTADANTEKLLNLCHLSSILDFAKAIATKADAYSNFGTPVQQFFKDYLNRYLTFCILRGNERRATEFSSVFVDAICDKTMNRDLSHLLQYICVHELARCIGSAFNKKGSQVFGIYLRCARVCSKRMLKFIKKHSPLKVGLSNGCEDDKMNCTDINDSIELATVEPEKLVVVDALVCIMIIAIENNDKEMLDEYSDLLLRLFSYMTYRVQKLIESVQNGVAADFCPIDSHLPKLFNLYKAHKDIVDGYLNYDFFRKISPLSITESEEGSPTQDPARLKKKNMYNHIKQKLESLEERANKSSDVYPTIINKQYSYVVCPSIGDIKDERSPCCHKYLEQLKTVQKIVSVVFSSGNLADSLKSTVRLLEDCDPLDHPRVLYLFLMLESLIPNNINSFTELSPRISSSLIRIVKSVELGPSIHAFTKAGRHKSNASIKCCTYANAARLYTTIFLTYPKMIESFVTDAMEICVASNLIEYAKNRKLDLFVLLGSSISQLLKTVCTSKREAFQSSLPVFLSILSLLIRCVIMTSDQINPALELLAIDIGRIFKNLGNHKVDLVAFAPYIITNYVKDIQRAHCTGRIRRKLDEGVFRVFNLVDAHQLQRREKVIELGQRKTSAGRASGSLFELVHSRLDQAGREVFRELHDDYNRFYRYQAKC